MANFMRTLIRTANAPLPVGAFSQAAIINGTMFISGQLGLDPASGSMVSGGAEAEADQALKNMGAILEAAGGTFDDVVKTTVLLADINDFEKVNSVYSKYFTNSLPARAAYQVAGLPKGGNVQVEAWAMVAAK